MNTLPSQVGISQETFSKMRISSSPGPYRDVCYIWYKVEPKDPFEGPEFNLICNRLLAGFDTKEKILAELAELALTGEIPPDVSPEVLARWTYWILCHVKVGGDLI